MNQISNAKRILLLCTLIGWGIVGVVTIFSLRTELREWSLFLFGYPRSLSGIFNTVLVLITLVVFVAYRDDIISITQKFVHRFNWLKPVDSNMRQQSQQSLFVRTILPVLLLMVVSGGLLFYRLGERDLFEDEFQVVDAAAGYYYTQSFWKWDWIADESGRSTYCPTEPPLCHYTRAIPHSWLIAQSYKIFGISEWSSRLVSALSGVVFVILTYAVARFFSRSNAVGLFTAAVVAFNPQYINFFRMTRMYALLLPLILFTIYSLYRGVTEQQQWINKQWVPQWFKRWFAFHYGFLAFAAVSIVIGLSLHIIHLAVLPGVVLFAVYQYHQKKEPKYLTILTIAVIGASVIGILWLFTNVLPVSITQFISFFNAHHLEYVRFVAQYPFIPTVGVSVLIVAMLGPLYIANNRERERLVFYSCIIVVALLFYVFVARRYSSFAYILPASIASQLLVCMMIGKFATTCIYTGKVWRIILVIVIFISAGNLFWKRVPELYGNNHLYGKFSIVSEAIVGRYKPGEAIIAQYPRRYYFRDVPTDTTVVSMLFNQQYTVQYLIGDVARTGKGWIMWEKRKQYHLKPSVVEYINKHFVRMTGPGFDNTDVEVYYFTAEMMNKT